jgi:hypothetical protein
MTVAARVAPANRDAVVVGAAAEVEPVVDVRVNAAKVARRAAVRLHKARPPWIPARHLNAAARVALKAANARRNRPVHPVRRFASAL